jgi:hypothetical protein
MKPGQIKRADKIGKIKGADQSRNVRSRAKEPIRDETSEEIKGVDQRRNVRGRSRGPIRDATSEQIKGVRLEQQPRSQQSEDQPR